MRLGTCLRVASVLVGFAALAGCGSDDSPAAAPTPATYTVGGTVSGLSGSVTLANNGGDARTVTANGTFTFSTALASGAAYGVTVTTQPTDQTCTVSSGTGTIASANVTTVSVSCVTNTPPPTYTIGGSVTGLQASGLVVQNNGGDNLSLSADGSFTFATAIASGSAYSVTVLTQPTNQLCVVVNASGVVGSAAVTNVAVNCQPATIAPTFTQQPQSQSVVEPSPATFLATATGNPAPMLQWQVSTDSGSTWTNISGATATSYTTPATTLADDGKFFRLVATNGSGTTNSNNARLTVTAAAGKSWRAPVVISDSGTGYDTYYPQVAANARGDSIAAWERASDDGWDIWVNLYVAGTGWQGATMIARGEAGANLMNPQVAIDSDGNAVVVWELRNPPGVNYSRTDIQSAYYSTSTGWTTPMLVETDDGDVLTPHEAWEPYVTMFDGGIALVVWSQQTGANDSSRGVYSSTSSGGSWGTPQIISGSYAANVRIAGTSAGMAVAAWNQISGAQTHVWAARYTGFGWNAATLIDTDTTVSGYGPAVAQSSNGDALVAWHGRQPMRIVAARYAGGAWSSDAPVSNSTDTMYDSSLKSVLDDDGNGLVMFDGSYGGTSMAWFTATLSSGVWSNGLPVLFESTGSDVDVAMNGAGQTLYGYVEASIPSKLRVSSNYSSGLNTTTALGFTNQPPRLEIAGNGEAIVIWIETDNGANKIWASEYR